MFMKILKFIGLLVLLNLLIIIPFGGLVFLGIIGFALWKLID